MDEYFTTFILAILVSQLVKDLNIKDLNFLFECISKNIPKHIFSLYG